MGRPRPRVVVANLIPIVGPNVPEVYYLRRLLGGVIHELYHRLLEHYLEARKHFLESYYGQLRLEEVGSIQAVQAIRPKHSPLPHDDLVILRVINIKLQVFLYVLHDFDAPINFLEICVACHLVEIIKKVFDIFVIILFNVAF